MRRRALLALPALVPTAQAGAQSAALAPTIAPTGKLRAVYLAGNPVQAVRDPSSGLVSGISYDLARELARQAGVELVFEPRPGIQPVIDAVRNNDADIGFLANDPSRRGPVLFSRTYLTNPQSALVPTTTALHSAAPASSIPALADLDRPGHRIAAGRTDSVGLHLARTLTQATFVPLDDVSVPALTALFAASRIDAFCASRLRLRQLAAAIAGLRVLPGSILGVPQAIIVPANAPTRLALVDTFLLAVRDNGLLQAAIIRSNTEAEIAE